MPLGFDKLLGKLRLPRFSVLLALLVLLLLLVLLVLLLKLLLGLSRGVLSDRLGKTSFLDLARGVVVLLLPHTPIFFFCVVAAFVAGALEEAFLPTSFDLMEPLAFAVFCTCTYRSNENKNYQCREDTHTVKYIQALSYFNTNASSASTTHRGGFGWLRWHVGAPTVHPCAVAELKLVGDVRTWCFVSHTWWFKHHYDTPNVSDRFCGSYL